MYPKDPKARAIVNHRLCFNLASYYSSIGEYIVSVKSGIDEFVLIKEEYLLLCFFFQLAPMFFDYERSPGGLKRMTINLNVFNTYLNLLGTKYAAGDRVTIADFQLITATMCTETIGFDLSPYPLVKQWYETYKKENPELWTIVEEGMKELAHFEKNPPDLSAMGTHPLHPIRKVK